MAWFAALVYGFPSEKLIVIGVTGTTGKTTSVFLIAKMLEGLGYKVGYTSTAMFNDGKKEWMNDKKMTMVGRFFTQKMIRSMYRNKCQFAIVETTSEGIVQFRHRFINYDTVVFTGLYPEHIESHGSFENYKEAKGRLFSHLKKCKYKFTDNEKRVIAADKGMKKIDLERVKKTIVANGDDEHKDYFLSFPADKKIIFTKNSESSGGETEWKIVRYGDIVPGKNGVSFVVAGNKIDLKLLGGFNADNAMTAVGVGVSLEEKYDRIREGLESIKGTPGRLERIDEGQDFTVIVDYAFEPGAVKKLYETINAIPHNNIIHVLGSTGGGRDVARRPVLGEIAGEKATYVIVANEDPYDDDPQTIIDQVAIGAERKGKKQDKDLFKIMDRRLAIKKALELAKSDDVVIITGKGNEQAICIANGEKIPWDDRLVTRELLKK